MGDKDIDSFHFFDNSKNKIMQIINGRERRYPVDEKKPNPIV